METSEEFEAGNWSNPHQARNEARVECFWKALSDLSNIEKGCAYTFKWQSSNFKPFYVNYAQPANSDVPTNHRLSNHKQEEVQESRLGRFIFSWSQHSFPWLFSFFLMEISISPGFYIIFFSPPDDANVFLPSQNRYWLTWGLRSVYFRLEVWSRSK